MEKMKIIVLDFGVGEVFIYDFDPNIFEDGSDFLAQDELSHSETNCQWMIVDNVLMHIK